MKTKLLNYNHKQKGIYNTAFDHPEQGGGGTKYTMGAHTLMTDAQNVDENFSLVTVKVARVGRTLEEQSISSTQVPCSSLGSSCQLFNKPKGEMCFP